MAVKQPEGFRTTTDAKGNVTQVEVLADGKWSVGEKADAPDKAPAEAYSVTTLSGCPGCTCWFWDGFRWIWYCC